MDTFIVNPKQLAFFRAMELIWGINPRLVSLRRRGRASQPCKTQIKKETWQGETHRNENGGHGDQHEKTEQAHVDRWHLSNLHFAYIQEPNNVKLAVKLTNCAITEVYLIFFCVSVYISLFNQSYCRCCVALYLSLASGLTTISASGFSVVISFLPPPQMLSNTFPKTEV